MTDEICGETKDFDGLSVECSKPPHPASDIHNAIVEDGETGSTSIGWFTR